MPKILFLVLTNGHSPIMHVKSAGEQKEFGSFELFISSAEQLVRKLEQFSYVKGFVVGREFRKKNPRVADLWRDFVA